MSRVLITGSSTGLGFMAGQLLVEQGHKVILHARNQRPGPTTRAGHCHRPAQSLLGISRASPAPASSLSKRTGSASLTP